MGIQTHSSKSHGQVKIGYVTIMSHLHKQTILIEHPLKSTV